LIITLGLGVLVYLPGLPGGFVHDDYPNIIENEKLHIKNLDSGSIFNASLSSESGRLKRPISMLTFALNYYTSELNPLGYKVFNIFIHIFVGLSLFFLCRLLLDCYEKLTNKTVDQNTSYYISLIATLAWLVSPINLTGVLYIVQRMTSLSALFSVLGLIFYVVARRSMIFHKKFNYYYFILCFICYVIAMLCKENAILNIFYLICIEVCFLHFLSNSKFSKKSFRLVFLILTITPIVAIVAWILLDPSNLLKGYEFRTFTLQERMLTQSRVLIYYLWWIIAPNITELGLYHDDILISHSLFEPLSTLISLIALSLLFVVSVIFIKKAPLLSFGILFFLSSHVLESSVIPLEMVYEHRNYLASFGILFSIITTVFYTITNSSTKKLAIFICGVWLCTIAITTSIRASQWGDAITHEYYEVSHHPKSARANFALAKTYANLSLAKIFDEKDKAIDLLEHSISLMPHEIIGEASAIIFSSGINIENKEKWIDNIIYKLNTFPITPITINSLKEINRCLSLNCNVDINQVFEFYKAALSNPNLAKTRYKSDLLSLYGQFCVNYLGELDIAYNAMLDAVEAAPQTLQYRINLIMLLIILNRYDEAIFHINFVENNDTFRLHSKTLRLLDKEISRAKNNEKDIL
jgi:hypothetical protein